MFRSIFTDNAMKKILSFIKNEIVLVVSLVAAAVTMFFVPPSAAYLGYINYSVIVLLFCLMLVVAGVIGTNLFGVLSEKILNFAKSERAVITALVAAAFFSSMLITNDVALITFVPFTVSIFGTEKKGRLIFAVVLETIAANLGSMATPVGNPQNLYIYDYFSLSAIDFVKIVLPAVILGAILVFLSAIIRKSDKIENNGSSEQKITDKKKLIVYAVLFAVCMATVLRLLDYRICLAVTIIAALIFDRKIFAKVDYCLLLTFVAFFVFVGNLRAIPQISLALSGIIEGREFLSAVAISQVISNVPAAVMLSGFTDNAAALLLGVDVGCLGTPVASLASLISLKLYSKSENADTKRYLLVFTVMNVVFLAIMVCFCVFVLKI